MLPDLLAHAGEPTVIASRVLKVWGETESGLNARLDDVISRLDTDGDVTLAFLARGWNGLEVRLTTSAESAAAAEAKLRPWESEIRALIGRAVFGSDSDSMESVVVDALRERGWTLGIAESLTAGLVAGRLGSVPGVSDVLRGSLVTYASDVKFDLLGVTPGPVISEEVALEMAAALPRARRRRRVGAHRSSRTRPPRRRPGRNRMPRRGRPWRRSGDDDAPPAHRQPRPDPPAQRDQRPRPAPPLPPLAQPIRVFGGIGVFRADLSATKHSDGESGPGYAPPTKLGGESHETVVVRGHRPARGAAVTLLVAVPSDADAQPQVTDTAVDKLGAATDSLVADETVVGVEEVQDVAPDATIIYPALDDDALEAALLTADDLNGAAELDHLGDGWEPARTGC